MKRYWLLLISLAITLIFLSGCGSHSDSKSTEKIESAIKETNSNQSAETIDLEPTEIETVNNFPGVNMTVKEGTFSSTGLTVVFENKSDKQCIYGEYFLLEKKIGESWYQVSVIIDGNFGFDSIGYNLAPGESKEWEVDWKWLYGTLEPGEYRIIKDILDFRGTGDFDTYYLAAEFVIN
jgi:uncharacterized cupredoxin-like copper-binding protein